MIEAGGAGHKMVMVVEGRADLYINSAASVYMWDTCGPHSLLASLGGGVVTFAQQKVTSGGVTSAQQKVTRSVVTSAQQKVISGGVTSAQQKVTSGGVTSAQQKVTQ